MQRQEQSFVKNSTITLFRQLTSIVIGFIVVILTARYLEPSGRGQFGYVTLIPLYLQTLLNFGVNSATVYYVGREEISVEKATNMNMFLSLILGGISIVIGIVTILLLQSTTLRSTPIVLSLLALTSVPFMFNMMFLQTIFQGAMDFKSYNMATLIQQFANVTFLIVFLVGFRLDLIGATLAFILSYICTSIYCMYILVRYYHVRYEREAFSFRYFKQCFMYGIKSHISNIATFLNYRVSYFILGSFVSPAAVGIYNTAIDVGERISIFSQSISSVLFPKITTIRSEEERNQLTAVVARNLLLWILLIGGLLFFISDWVVPLLFGQAFRESALILKICLPGLVLLSVEKLLSNDLAGRGRPEFNMYLSIYNAILSSVLSYFLIRAYGIVGAAYSVSAVYSQSFVIKLLIYCYVTKLSILKLLIIRKEDVLIYKRIFTLYRKK